MRTGGRTDGLTDPDSPLLFHQCTL